MTQLKSGLWIRTKSVLKKEIKVSKSILQKCSSPLAPRKRQIKPTFSFHFTPMNMTKTGKIMDGK